MAFLYFQLRGCPASPRLCPIARREGVRYYVKRRENIPGVGHGQLGRVPCKWITSLFPIMDLKLVTIGQKVGG